MKILIHILYCFTTLPLLHMRSVNHRIQNLIVRIVHSRLLLAASLKDRKLILECYHPSAQYTEPYLFCDYLGTPGLSESVAGQGSIYAAHTGDGLLRSLYSHFRPTRKRPDSKAPRSHPAGDIPASRMSDLAMSRSERQDDADVVKRIVNLDANENFSQLIFSTDLVQLGPRRGLFTDIVKVNDKTTLRIFRQWAAHQVTETRRSLRAQTSADQRTSTLQETRDSEITWIDDLKRKAGLKIQVEERNWKRDVPLLLRTDEEQAVSYSMHLQGKPNMSKAGIDDLYVPNCGY